MLFSTCLFVYNARNSLSRCSNSTKIVVRWGFAPDPLGELAALPQTPLLDSRGPTPKAPTPKGRGGEEGERRGREVRTPKNSLE